MFREVINKKEEAKDLNNQIENSLESLINIVENQKILIVISPQSTLSNQIFVAGNFIYFEDIIKASNNISGFKVINFSLFIEGCDFKLD